MSHITKAKLSFEITNDAWLKYAMELMSKTDKYKITEENGVYTIDLSSVGINHSYGGEYSHIKLQKDEKTGEYSLIGDRWSINEGYDRTCKALHRSYLTAAVVMSAKRAGGMGIKTIQTEKTTNTSIGRVKVAIRK